MSNGQLRASDGSLSKETEDLVRALPNWMPKDPKSGNFSLLIPAGQRIERAEADIETIKNETILQYASKIGSIELISESVGAPQSKNDSVEKYRLKTISEFQSITNESTIDNILQRISSLLNVNIENLEYEEQNGFSIIYIPSLALENLTISVNEFSTIVNSLSVAGYSIDIQITGTLDFVTPEQYQSGEYDSEFGYDSLDTDGEPGGTGGTYSAIIN
jgi:hypothetical protein